ncbi:hypothetical protein NDU88_002181 [Pleurodeles waltl]|uniref:Uncharacterized protein n=1 Tax=Pleurodeles waltl TaxID=8319 RepID=A0AAV7RA68_PLEWA|nr:hypothetical protein NDU88_002181 [Pleurodeles waltl]
MGEASRTRSTSPLGDRRDRSARWVTRCSLEWQGGTEYSEDIESCRAVRLRLAGPWLGLETWGGRGGSYLKGAAAKAPLAVKQ